MKMKSRDPLALRLVMVTSLLAVAGCFGVLRGTSAESSLLERLHTACSSDKSCSPGQTCVRWADEASRLWKTCELLCDFEAGEGQCPPPLECTRITDGPGETCRALEERGL